MPTGTGFLMPLQCRKCDNSHYPMAFSTALDIKRNQREQEIQSIREEKCQKRKRETDSDGPDGLENGNWKKKWKFF
jgi:hypothetical protein